MGASVTADVARHPRAAGQPVVRRPLGGRKSRQLVLVEWGERALGHHLALETGAPPRARLLYR